MQQQFAAFTTQRHTTYQPPQPPPIMQFNFPIIHRSLGADTGVVRDMVDVDGAGKQTQGPQAVATHKLHL